MNEEKELNLADFEEAPAEDANASEEAETEETSEEEGKTGEADEAKPKGKPIQERFDEMTAARREAEREAEYWKSKALGEPKAEKPKEEAPEDTRPDPTTYDLGDLDPQYIDDLTSWKATQEVAKALGEYQRQAEVKAQTKQLQEKYRSQTAKAVEKYPDYHEVVEQGAARVEWVCSDYMGAAILESEVGHDMAYHLANNKAEALRIANLSPAAQLREMGRLEAKFLDSTETPKPSNAPPPPKGQVRGAGGQYATTQNALYDKALEEMK